MKLKRILACSISAILLFSNVIANAELTIVDDANVEKAIATFPTEDEIKARTPSLAITPTKLTTSAEVSPYALNAFWYNGVKDKDIYKLDFAFSNLGGLFNGFNKVMDGTTTAVGIYSAKVQIDNSVLAVTNAQATAKKAILANTSTTIGADSSNITMLCAADSVYPYLAEDGSAGMYVSQENGTLNTVALIAVEAGTYASINDITATISYKIIGNGDDKIYTNTFALNTPLVIGTAPVTPDPEPAAELAISATQSANTATGYIWDVNVTKGEGGALAAFDALFTDKDGNKAERMIRTGLDVLNSKLTAAEGNGSVAFKVGLKTKREISNAKFTVTDLAGATASNN